MEYLDNVMQKLLIIMHGFQASGKSTTAKLLSKELNASIVATHLIRAKIADKKTAYTEEITNKVYAMALEIAESQINISKIVIIDAMFAQRSQRYLAYQMAERCEARTVVIHCVCPDIKVTRQRVRERKRKNTPEAEGDKMKYYYRTKALTDSLEEDEISASNKPVIITVNTITSSVVSNQTSDGWVESLTNTLTSALLKQSQPL